MHEQDELTLRRLLEPARALVESEAVVATAVAATRTPTSWWRRRWTLLAVVVAVLVPASAVAIHAIRATPGSAGDAFTDYLAGIHPENWPGRPYEGEPPPGAHRGGPSKILLEREVEPRILALRGPIGIYVGRTENGRGLLLELPGLGMGMPRHALFQWADEQLLRLNSPAAPDRYLRRGLVPLYGLAGEDVASVRVDYASGPPSREAAADGGFIALVAPLRRPRTIEGLNGDGQVIARIPAGTGWREARHTVRRFQRERRRTTR